MGLYPCKIHLQRELPNGIQLANLPLKDFLGLFLLSPSEWTYFWLTQCRSLLLIHMTNGFYGKNFPWADSSCLLHSFFPHTHYSKWILKYKNMPFIVIILTFVTLYDYLPEEYTLVRYNPLGFAHSKLPQERIWEAGNIKSQIPDFH